ncbi:leucine-rich repeat-containing protein 19 [Ambystoma mexicanum]|uniref:leucine-rich repeat-containing protein 19 n=1 Tax=Ambystoma mexicanum TaxID=8296 RepID=UPI0037E8124E
MDIIYIMTWMVMFLTSIMCTTSSQQSTLSSPTNSSTATISPNTIISPSSYTSGKSSGPENTLGQIPSLPTATNTSGNSTDGKAPSSLGKSWNFLAGVVGVVLTTSFLIIMAVKFPKWYNYLVSYNHHRLQEYQPDMFDQEFNADMSAVPQTTPSMVDEDDCMVVFEQKSTFVIDDDGFIEDKYIDAQELTEET